MAQLSHPFSAPPAGEVLRERYASRLPASLDELHGPVSGPVELPLHIAWSGLRTYDLDRPRQRMSLYRTVLAEARYEDLTALLDRDLLVELWPALRTLVSRHIRQVWEETFPQLAARATSAA